MAESVVEEGPLFQLSNLHLKKIVKENHGHSIKQLKFCETHPNLLASVGGTQASIYDNDNAGEHLDITMNFVNMDTPALLKVLAVSESVRKKSVASDPIPPVSGHFFSQASESHPVAPIHSVSTPPSLEGIKISDESRTQLHAMRAIVEDGGFDEDIHVGAKELGLFAPRQSNLKSVDENTAAINSTGESSQTASDILQNKRLMQGAGRDVELFDRSDRKLRTCAWVAFPPRRMLNLDELVALRDAVRLRSRATALDDQLPSLNGACDVDVTRVDRTDAWLAVAGADGLVQLLSVAYAKALYALPGHCEPIIALASGQMSTCLASLSQNWIIIWNIALIARHHYNAYHFGGPGLEYIHDEDDVFGTNGVRYGDATTTENTHNSWPDHLKRLPKEFQRWILQVIPTPSPLLTTLEFTQFGLVAGASSGHLYNWPFIPREASFSATDFISHPRDNALLEDTDTIGPRTQSAKRPAPGAFPRPQCPPFWSILPRAVVSTTSRLLSWLSHGECITGLAHKRGTSESPTAGIAIRTNNRLVLIAPLSGDEGITSSTGQSMPCRVQTMCEINIPGTSPTSSSAPSVPVTRQSAWEASLNPKNKPGNHQGVDISLCGRFAMVGMDSGDAYLIDLPSSSIISKLEHKRSKIKITSCVMSHHLKNVVFASDAIIWRWDFLSPSFLQKERAEQAQAEAEGVDIASESDVEDPGGAME